MEMKIQYFCILIFSPYVTSFGCNQNKEYNDVESIAKSSTSYWLWKSDDSIESE